ncbi:MAG: hypothetical protein HY901_35075, partial [Deltaproteobacteria bacterium]|nr:hypothetical protein [Deltaproteobacteria bacterium]
KSASDVYVGEDGSTNAGLHHWDGSAWSVLNPGNYVIGLFGYGGELAVMEIDGAWNPTRFIKTWPGSTTLFTGSSRRLVSAAEGAPGELWVSEQSYYSSTYTNHLSKVVGGIAGSATTYNSSDFAFVAPRTSSDVWYASSSAGGKQFNGSSWASGTIGGVPAVTFNAAHTSNGRSFFVGRWGQILRRDGAGWSRLTSRAEPVTGQPIEGINAVYPYSSTKLALDADVFHADGTTERIFGFWDGTSFSGVTSLASAWQEVSFFSADGNTGWMVSSRNSGVGIRFNGTTWETPVALPAGGYFAGMGGSAPDDVWATAPGLTLHYTNTWSTVNNPYSGSSTALRYPVSKSTSLAFAVAGTAGSNMNVIRWNGTSWALDASAPSGTYYNLWTAPGESVWASGSFGVRRFDVNSNQWVDMAVPAIPTGPLAASNDTNVLVPAASDRLWKWNGTAWTVEQCPSGLFAWGSYVPPSLLHAAGKLWLTSVQPYGLFFR